MPEFEYLALSLVNNILHLQLARPNKANAMNRKMWFEIGEAYRWINNFHQVPISTFCCK
jgi:enoyl-CoA hydratase/carnithine racemase